MHLKSSSIPFISIVFICLLFIVQPSWAGRVVKVKGKKVLIMLEGDEVSSTFKGDLLYLTTPSGKKRALVKVRAMKGRKVIAQLGKGKAKRGMLTLPKSKKPISTYESAEEVAQAESDAAPSGGPYERPNLMFGLQGSYGIATQNVTSIADMSGSSMGVKALLDYALFSSFGVRARVGMDMFSVTGSDGTTDYETSINYLTIDLLLRWSFYQTNSFGAFLNGGMGIYSPLSTELGTTEALQEDSISTTSLLIFGGGLTLPLGGLEIYAGADYFYFPPSEDVETSVISGKLGLLFSF